MQIKETQMRSSRHDADIDTRLKDIEDTVSVSDPVIIKFIIMVFLIS